MQLRGTGVSDEGHLGQEDSSPTSDLVSSARRSRVSRERRSPAMREADDAEEVTEGKEAARMRAEGTRA